MRIPLTETRKPHQIKEFSSLGSTFTTSHPLRLQAELNVGARRTPGKQRVLLEDHGPIQAWPSDRLAVDEDLTRGRFAQPAEQIEQGRLARSTRSDQ